MSREIVEAFGRALKALRVSAALTQEELALHAGIQRKHVSSLELGQKQPNVSTVFALATALGIEPSQLVTRTQQELQKRQTT